MALTAASLASTLARASVLWTPVGRLDDGQQNCKKPQQAGPFKQPTLLSHNTTTPAPPNLRILVVVVGLHRTDQIRKLLLVLCPHIVDAERRRGLFVHNRSETGFALDDAVGDAHFAAEGWEPDDELF